MTLEEYKKNLPQYPAEDLTLLEKAFEFVQIASEDKKDDYFTKPARISLKVAEIGLDAKSVATTLLRQALEDGLIDLKTVRKKFGEEIASLAKALINVRAISLQSKEKSVEAARKMFLAVAEDIRVVIIKLLERLDKMERLHALDRDSQKRLSFETLEIYAPVADRLGMGDMKAKLEDLAFQYAYPEEFSWIQKEVKERIPQREKYLESVIPVIKKEMAREKIKILDIHWRDKHLYSLWRKLQRYDMNWDLIFDLVAVRIIVENIESCYASLGLIHKLWRPLSGRIKDFIALPKQNGYQSLHTTVFCLNDVVAEFQIRTPQMHENAETGIASHWAWEMAGKPAQGPKLQASKSNWIKQLRQWHKAFDKTASDKSFLESLKIDFFKDRVFVLTPKGDALDLPEGATPVDFAYAIHSEIGEHMAGAKVNGRIVPFNHKLASGDIVEIVIQKNKKPNPEWLTFAKTSLAKGHIRSYLNKYGYLSGVKS